MNAGQGLFIAVSILLGVLVGHETSAQTLPAHEALRILVVSDEVNPHGLPPGQLTQPGELSAVLAATPALNIDTLPESLFEIPTNAIDQATSRLKVSPSDPAGYDVLVYFAHRRPDNGMNDQARQEAFVAAVGEFLVAGGGVVSFHHGIYETTGKASMQDLLGGQATGAVPWNTVTGQNVIALGPYHFVSHHAVLYPGRIPYSDTTIGVAAGDYLAFNNTPDERYPNLSARAGLAGIEVLFGSDYNEGGTTHLLGYVRNQPQWLGAVVVYQPGEYEPNALGPGNNYQILLNAILFAANHRNGDWLFIDGFEGGSMN